MKLLFLSLAINIFNLLFFLILKNNILLEPVEPAGAGVGFLMSLIGSLLFIRTKKKIFFRIGIFGFAISLFFSFPYNLFSFLGIIALCNIDEKQKTKSDIPKRQYFVTGKIMRISVYIFMILFSIHIPLFSIFVINGYYYFDYFDYLREFFGYGGIDSLFQYAYSFLVISSLFVAYIFNKYYRVLAIYDKYFIFRRFPLFPSHLIHLRGIKRIEMKGSYLMLWHNLKKKPIKLTLQLLNKENRDDALRHSKEVITHNTIHYNIIHTYDNE